MPAATELLKTDIYEAHCHSVRFQKLKPKSRYVYRVGDGANFSEWFQFRTASDKPERLRFLYFGDAQNEVKSHWSRAIRGAYSDVPQAHFLLHAGDLINRANKDAEWGEWFAAGWVNGMVPTVPLTQPASRCSRATGGRSSPCPTTAPRAWKKPATSSTSRASASSV